MTGPPSAARPVAVIDTNVALDWFAFRDPVVAPPLDEAYAAGGFAWIATPAMREEFVHVLTRGVPSRPQLDVGALVATWDRRATIVEPAPAAGGGWVCSDGDDQKFIDLALARRADWLLTRDRALLALARRALDRGLRIETPARWIARARAATVPRAG